VFDRAFYDHVAQDAGLDPSAGTYVVGVRGIARDGTRHEVRAAQVFDDVIAVIAPGGDPLELAGSTHPWFSTSSAAPDVDGDGVPDVGMVQPGRYRALPRGPSRNIVGEPTYHIVTLAGADAVPGWRDTNHDGVFDADEQAASVARGDTLGAVLFHQGGAGAPAAIGCQVMDATSIRAFVGAVGGAAATIDYVLVNAP